MENKKIRWGLMGAGNILNNWMKGAMQFEDMEIKAIASRTAESAKRQSEHFGIPDVLTYEEIVARDDIDVLYVNSIHPAHAKLSIMAMNNGKSVLVEKPAAVNRDEFIRMTECAKNNNVFLMEAAWTRFFPIFSEIRNIIAKGVIGDLRVLQSAFGFSVANEQKTSRLFDINQAGGSLLDVGVYPLMFSDIILGKNPQILTGCAAVNTDQNRFSIDETAGMIAQYDNGVISMMNCSIRSNMSETAYIYGANGYIEIPNFYHPEKAIIHIGNSVKEIQSVVPQRVDGVKDFGYQFEIAHVNDCIRKNLNESPIATFKKTEAILSQCDLLRKQWNIKYPFE